MSAARVTRFNLFDEFEPFDDGSCFPPTDRADPKSREDFTAIEVRRYDMPFVVEQRMRDTSPFAEFRRFQKGLFVFGFKRCL